MSLDSLPAEVLYCVLQDLDLLSIYSLTRSKRSIHTRVQAHTGYHVLTTNGTTVSTLKTLRQTELITKLTLSTLFTTLTSPRCSCCNHHSHSLRHNHDNDGIPKSPAPYIHLPTGQRACFLCLHRCPSFEVIPLGVAMRTFGLAPAEFASITMQTIPGKYELRDGVCSLFKPKKLVSAVQARDVAVAAVGATALDTYMASRNVDVTPYLQVFGHSARFVTPYTNMPFDVCCVGAAPALWEAASEGLEVDEEEEEEEESWTTSDTAAATIPTHLKKKKKMWSGATGVTCEPWPWLDLESGTIVLDEQDVVRCRLAIFQMRTE